MKKDTHTKPSRASLIPKVSLGGVVRENLPFPLVYYPNHYGTFFGFSTSENDPIVFCSCAKPAIENLFRLTREQGEQIQRGDDKVFHFPKIVGKRLIEWDGVSDFPFEFVNGLCHRCNLTPPSLRYCHEMYGTKFVQSFGWYINQTYLRLGMTPGGGKYLRDICPKEFQPEIDEVYTKSNLYQIEFRRLINIAYGQTPNHITKEDVLYWNNVTMEDAVVMIDLRRMAAKAKRKFTIKIENIVRNEFGFSNIGEGWVSETLLFKIVKRILPGNEVLFHHRPEWLEGLELDIFIPKLKVGVEYQGVQHYHPIKAWGGEEALSKLKLRDAKKAVLCKQNGIRLIAISFTEPLTEDFVYKILTAPEQL